MLRRNLPAIGICAVFITALFFFALPNANQKCIVDSNPSQKSALTSGENVNSTSFEKKIRMYNYDMPPSELKSEIGDKAPRVIILTPVKNAAKHIEKYFENLERMAYPKHLTSLAFLTSDSDDGTYEKLQAKLEEVKHKYRHVTHFVKNFHYELSNEERHGWQAQIPRRKVMSMSRNFLITAIKDEDWVVWWDVDVTTFPHTIIEDLIRWNKDVIQPNCYYKMSNGKDYPYDLNTWQETSDSRKFQEDKKEDDILLEGYPDVMWTHRLYLNDYRGRSENLVELDGVGGTFLMVRADVHRAGANFPAFPVKHQLETEGFAKWPNLWALVFMAYPIISSTTETHKIYTSGYNSFYC
ncbi:Anp1-domain-containing protein [Syncephalis fuscata]|nr:Anp1-domain-containing protein [Syncephalis fuscata]